MNPSPLYSVKTILDVDIALLHTEKTKIKKEHE